MQTLRILLVMFLLALGGIAPSYAINPDEILDDPVLEARARGLTIQLRCLVCQNQSIDDSDAELARDLRLLVRERLTLGDSDPAVIEFVVARYGDFVLLRPPFKLSTLLLWGTPIAALLIGFAVVLIRSRRKAPATALTGAEEKALEALLDKMDGGASIAAPQDNSSEDQIR